jgi:hypothetical protein
LFPKQAAFHQPPENHVDNQPDQRPTPTRGDQRLRPAFKTSEKHDLTIFVNVQHAVMEGDIRQRAPK